MKKGAEHVRSIEDFGKLSVRYNNVNVSETLEVFRCGSMVMQKLCCDNRSACLAQLLVGHKVDLARLITFHQQCYRCSNRHVAGVSNHNIIYHNISKGYCTWMLPETPLSTWLKSNPRHQLHKASRTQIARSRDSFCNVRRIQPLSCITFISHDSNLVHGPTRTSIRCFG